MVDFRVSDGFGQHPKTLGITLQAAGLWVLAGAWSSRYLTDGYIPPEAMTTIAPRGKPAMQELVDRNLLTPLGEGHVFVDWLQYQRSRDQVEAERARGRERLAKWRAQRGGM